MGPLSLNRRQALGGVKWVTYPFTKRKAAPYTDLFGDDSLFRGSRGNTKSIIIRKILHFVKKIRDIKKKKTFERVTHFTPLQPNKLVHKMWLLKVNKNIGVGRTSRESLHSAYDP